jgi:GTP-binding protein
VFVDRITLSLFAGNGGNGAIAWRREKFIPKGGPAGGDGGNGGSIILEATSDLLSLESLRNRRIIKAKNGQMGGGGNCKGKNGSDLVIRVPVGTLVKNVITQEIIYDFTQKAERWKICAGGKGGKGNSRFKTSTNQAPLIYTEGTPGESVEAELELKLIADVGLVGMPNAGKSTLVSRLANISVKIAPYPFTTLRPNLGQITLDGESRLLIADIPGIIENANADRGLGLAFLRHVERCSVLVFVIELAVWEEARDAYAEFIMLRKEMLIHNPALLDKPFLVVLNKIDLDNASVLAQRFRENYPFPLETLFEVSAQRGDGCDALKKYLLR